MKADANSIAETLPFATIRSRPRILFIAIKLVGAVLLSSALFKWLDRHAILDADPEHSILASFVAKTPWRLFMLCVVEAVLGGFLLIGRNPAVVNRVALVLVGGFAGLLTTELFKSESRACGCIAAASTIKNPNVKTELGISLLLNVAMITVLTFSMLHPKYADKGVAP